MSAFIVRSPQNGRRMHCRQHILDCIERQQLTSFFRDAKIPTEKSLCRRRTQTDDYIWLYERDLCIQPLPAGGNLDGIRFLMNAPLTARLPLEVLYGVGDIGLLAIDTRLD